MRCPTAKCSIYLNDRTEDWSEPPWRSIEIYHGKTDRANYNAYGIWQDERSAKAVNPNSLRGPYCKAVDVPENAYQDGKVAEKTIADLERLKAMNKPFFLACGFWRPHLPFNAPCRVSGYSMRELNLLDPYKVWTWDPAARRPYRGYPKKQLPMWHRYRVEFHIRCPGNGEADPAGIGAGLDVEVVFQLVHVAVVDQVDTGPQLFIDDLAIGHRSSTPSSSPPACHENS